jgi:hypothetical protein
MPDERGQTWSISVYFWLVSGSGKSPKKAIVLICAFKLFLKGGSVEYGVYDVDGSLKFSTPYRVVNSR